MVDVVLGLVTVLGSSEKSTGKVKGGGVVWEFLLVLKRKLVNLGETHLP